MAAAARDADSSLCGPLLLLLSDALVAGSHRTAEDDVADDDAMAITVPILDDGAIAVIALAVEPTRLSPA